MRVSSIVREDRAMRRAGPVLALVVALAPLTALADEAHPCWEPGARTGVFGWTQSPAQACRSGETITGAPARLAAPDPHAPSPAAPTETDAPAGPVFEFTGQASVGFAVSF